MPLKSDLSAFDPGFFVEPGQVTEHQAFGICEVISVGACDELPYVFEISGGQRLSFSLSASHEVDLVLCDERAHDEWVDNGLTTEHPLETILMLRHDCHHSMEFKPEADTTLVAIIVNLAKRPVQSNVAASVVNYTRKPC